MTELLRVNRSAYEQDETTYKSSLLDSVDSLGASEGESSATLRQALLDRMPMRNCQRQFRVAARCCGLPEAFQPKT